MTTERKFLLADHTIDHDDLNDLIEWLRGDPWLTQGELVREYERRWADFNDTRFATFVNSGSSANLLMYYVAKLSGRLANDKVIVPAVGWATSIAPAIQFGFEPIMCDADPRTFGLDLDHLRMLLEQHRPGAVVLVHVLGVPNDMRALRELQEEFGFLMLEDACAATGSEYRRQRVGSFGDLATFSFFYGHHLSTIEGGMVFTGDEELDDLLKMTRSHGWAKDLSPAKQNALAERYQVSDFNRQFTFYHPGFNVRGSDLGARIGLSQLKRVDRTIERRVENHATYQERFLGSETFECQVNPDAKICSISFVALARDAEHRDEVVARLREHRIETRPLGGGNMSRQPFWSERYDTLKLPFADRIHDTAFHLPNNPRISVDDVHSICDVVLAGTR